MRSVIDFCNGKFGKYQLVAPYRQIWKVLVLLIIGIGVLKVMFLFFAWWEGIVIELNHMIWTR